MFYVANISKIFETTNTLPLFFYFLLHFTTFVQFLLHTYAKEIEKRIFVYSFSNKIAKSLVNWKKKPKFAGKSFSTNLIDNVMKKIFTLISMAFVAMSMNAQTEETFVAIDQDGNIAAEYAAIIGEGGVATNVENGKSIVKFGTANVSVEAVGSADPADLPDGGQDITVGNLVDAENHLYELVSINSTKDIKWEVKNQGDINFWYVAGTGTPAVSLLAEEIYTDGEPTGKYRLSVKAFDPAVGGEPQSGLYYKFTTAVDGALKVGIWANKGNRTTFLVDGETKQPSQYLAEGYINGQNYTEEDAAAGICTPEQVGKKKYLTNDEILAVHNAGNQANPWIIGAGNQNFWGNVIIDAKAGKTYWLFQGNSQIGFQAFTFAPGKTKEEMVTGIEAVRTTVENNADAPIFNLAGQKVDKSYKGVKVQNGRKFF